MKCTECGNDFRQVTTWQHFCSPECRNKHNNRDYRNAIRAYEITASGEVVEIPEKIKTKLREIAAKRVDKSRPAPRRVFRPRLKEKELWNREERLEMSALAEAFIKAKEVA